MKETVDKVIEFAQSETNTKSFRPDYPVSEELRESMMDTFSDFMYFTLDAYFNEVAPILEEYVEELKTREEKKDILLHNLFWWRILYDAIYNYSESCIAEYLAEKNHELDSRAVIVSWLKESWKASPKFYYVGYKFNDRFFVVVDILTEKTIDVLVCDPLATPPKNGEIVMGTLIPLGNGLHAPIVDFYHFDYKARIEIVRHLHYYYNRYSKNLTPHETFLHVLSAMLQIERLIFIETQEKIPPK
ncbi:hypothetical protein J2Y67_002219 [Neobacillus niacini]|nr:hypothetical protein [Neobacillus niacini]